MTLYYNTLHYTTLQYNNNSNNNNNNKLYKSNFRQYGQMKSRDGKSQQREEEKIPEKRKSQKNEDPGARKGRKVAKHCVFPIICGSRWSKSRLAKARVRSHLARRCGAKHISKSNVQSKLGCRKSARQCSAKHISKSKCTKHLSFGTLLEVAMSKKCTLLWREAHVEVKMYKTL